MNPLFSIQRPGRKFVALAKRLALTSSVAIGVALAGVWACSYGAGTTPSCDADASPDAVNACRQNSYCDDGLGGVQPLAQCCNLVVLHAFETCSNTTVPDNTEYQKLCPASGAAPACCATLIYGEESYVAQKLYDGCMAGDLSYQKDAGGGAKGGGGTGGTGGGTPAGGSGGSHAAGNGGGGAGNGGAGGS